MTLKGDPIDAVYTRAYDSAYFLGYNGDFGQRAGIAAGVHAVAEWSRQRALEEAAEVAVKSGKEWLDLWQPNAKLPEVWDFIASDIRDFAKGIVHE